MTTNITASGPTLAAVLAALGAQGYVNELVEQRVAVDLQDKVQDLESALDRAAAMMKTQGALIDHLADVTECPESAELDVWLGAMAEGHRNRFDILTMLADSAGFPVEGDVIDTNALVDHIRHLAEGLAARDVTLMEVGRLLNAVPDATLPAAVQSRLEELEAVRKHAVTELNARIDRIIDEADQSATLAAVRADRIADLEGELMRVREAVPALRTFKADDLVWLTFKGGERVPGIIKGDDPDAGTYFVKYYDCPPNGSSGEATSVQPEQLEPRSGDEPGDPAPDPEKPKRAPRKKKAESAESLPEGVTREEYADWKAQQEALGRTEHINPMEYKRQRDAAMVGLARVVEKKPEASGPWAGLTPIATGTRVSYAPNPAGGLYEPGQGVVVGMTKVFDEAGYTVECDKRGRVAVRHADTFTLPTLEPADATTEVVAPKQAADTTQAGNAEFEALPAADLEPGSVVRALLDTGEVVTGSIEKAWGDGARVQLVVDGQREFVSGDRLRAPAEAMVPEANEPAAVLIPAGAERFDPEKHDLPKFKTDDFSLGDF